MRELAEHPECVRERDYLTGPLCDTRGFQTWPLKHDSQLLWLQGLCARLVGGLYPDQCSSMQAKLKLLVVISIAVLAASNTDTRRCARSTGGTCQLSPCWPDRNAVCYEGMCLCREGDCAYDGSCVTGPPNPSADCSIDTGGTCFLFGCNGARHAECLNGQCCVSGLDS